MLSKDVYNQLRFLVLGSLKIIIFKILFRDRGSVHKKEYSVYAFDNVANSGPPVN